MKARNGQVALYLLAVLTAIAILVFMNVDVFLAIRAKNHATSAGDAAAIAVARYQGELLNQVGDDNLAQLEAALRNDLTECTRIMARQQRRVFLDPLEGIRIGSEAAKLAVSRCETGGKPLAEDFETAKMRKILRDHAFDVRGTFAADPQLYPEPWTGAWEEYATRLELALVGEVVAGPENAEFADAYTCIPLLDQGFYNAVAGAQWCWFHWNGEWIFDRDSHNMPRPVFTPSNARVNSEIYSLHLDFKSLPAVLDEEWTNVIRRLTGCSEAAIRGSWLLTSSQLKFAFFDHRWDSWRDSDIRFSIDGGFPLIGDVKPEYDVLGCAAICRVVRTGARAGERENDLDRTYDWTAAAKPFGTVVNLDDQIDVVTSLKRFVTPCFTDVRLVPVDSVGGRDLHTADYDWMVHVRDHLPRYFVYGPAGRNCWYCQQLVTWENPLFRQQGRRWLRYNSKDCVRPTGNGGGWGGTSHAH